jgi:predicted HicB family RNase H-like nuclease
MLKGLNIRVSKETYKKIEVEAKKQDRSISNLVRNIVNAFFEKNRKINKDGSN